MRQNTTCASWFVCDLDFAIRVRPGGPWDHKPEIRQTFGDRSNVSAGGKAFPWYPPVEREGELFFAMSTGERSTGQRFLDHAGTWAIGVDGSAIEVVNPVMRDDAAVRLLPSDANGSFLLLVDANRVGDIGLEIRAGGLLRLADVTTGEVVTIQDPGDYRNYAAVLSPDGRLVATMAQDVVSPRSDTPDDFHAVFIASTAEVMAGSPNWRKIGVGEFGAISSALGMRWSDAGIVLALATGPAFVTVEVAE